MSLVLELIGQIGIFIMLIVIALLSRRLGAASRTKFRYIGFILAIVLMGVSIAVRILNITFNFVLGAELHTSLLWMLLYDGLPAAALTIGVVAAWRYWSWLLAERG